MAPDFFTDACSNDHYYYPLFQLPELLIVAVFSIPTLLARISLVYPSLDSVPEPGDLEVSTYPIPNAVSRRHQWAGVFVLSTTSK